MNAFISHFIDRAAMRFAAARMPKPDGRDLRLDEAGRLLREKDILSFKNDVPNVQFIGKSAFRFDSPRPCPHALNNIVHGRLFPCCDEWWQKPTVLLLHGWNDMLNHYFFFPRYARHLNDVGLNAATIQLPWHFNRRPRDLGAWGNFLSADILRTVEAALQSLADIHGFVNWLLAQRCPFVALWGVSMGAWLTGLTLGFDPRIAAGILTVPIGRMDRMINEAPFCETIRQALGERRVEAERLSLISNKPIVDKRNILIVEAEHDLFMPKESVEDLWREWGEPEIWRYRCGHITILAEPGLSKRVARWLSTKAAELASK